MDIIKQMQAETNNTLSGVAFRNLGEPGNNVSVRWIDNQGYSTSHWQWFHRDSPISEVKARDLLKTIPHPEVQKEVDEFVFSNGWSMKRENGVVRLAKNGFMGVDAYGKWVLRDEKGDAVDMDKNRDDMINRHEKTIGKPIVQQLLTEKNFISEPAG